MSHSTNEMIGSVVWVHGPNPKRLPFMAYIASVNDAMVECYMVHEEEFLATADDLIYDDAFHMHHLPLVVQPRLSAEIPITNVGQTVAHLNLTAIREIAQMAFGDRRPAERTGILIRSEDEFRWDHVMFQKRHLDAILDEIYNEDESSRQLSLLMTSVGRGETADVALRHLVTLMRDGSWDLLNLSAEKLQSLGIPGLAAEFISAAAAAAAEELLNEESVQGEIEFANEESIVRGMRTQLHNSRSREELANA